MDQKENQTRGKASQPELNKKTASAGKFSSPGRFAARDQKPSAAAPAPKAPTQQSKTAAQEAARRAKPAQPASVEGQGVGRTVRPEQGRGKSAPQQSQSAQEKAGAMPVQNGNAPKQPAARTEKVPDASQQGKSAQGTAAANKARAPEKGKPGDKSTAAGKGKPAAKGKNAPKKRQRPVDSGYVPYQQAKQKRKKVRTSMLANLLNRRNAGENVGMADNPTFKQKPAKKAPPPAVVYTDPKPFSRSRFLVQLLSVFAVVVALVLGLSVFFRVKNVTVTGAEAYSAYTIRQASGISEGDNLLTFGRARAAGQILANLPYVRNVRIGIKLPDTVKIEIEEEDIVYAIKDIDNGWWLMNSNGKIVSQSNLVTANQHTKVEGVELDVPTAGEIAVAHETFVPAEGEETNPAVVTSASKLDAALDILQQLEKNDIMGEVASVDVTRLDDIVLWYGTQYQVNLGDVGMTEYKIACMVDVILQMSDYQNGILDISFTTWPDQVGFTPFG